MKTIEENLRPWGYYVILADEPTHKVKRIVVNPGERLSLQCHQKRAEHWFIISGRAKVTLDDQEFDLERGKAVDIPMGAKHRIANIGSVELQFVEVQTGNYFGEDDIERFQDDYGRTK